MTATQTRVVLFFVATFILSWASILGNRLWPSSVWDAPVNSYGPILAALLVISLTEGRLGFARFWRLCSTFRAPLWLYAIALLVPITILLFSLARAALSGVEFGPLPAREWTGFLVLVPILLLDGPLQEHPSFQGFAQQTLEQDLSALTAAILIGIGVFIWHLPIFILSGFWPPIALGIIGMAIVNAWMLKAGGSVWPLVLAHLSVNYFGGSYLNRTITDPMEQTFYQGLIGGGYVLWAGYLAWRYGPELTDQHNDRTPHHQVDNSQLG